MRFRLVIRRGLVGFLALLVGVPHLSNAQGSGHAQALRVHLDDSGCRSCHAGIEEMHSESGLDCVSCHGGNGTASTQIEAHVRAPVVQVEDERVAPLDRDLAWLQFRNPMDLRVVDRTCGTCHAAACSDLALSLHATTAGHLSDGYYEMGLLAQPGSRYGVFPVPAARGREGEVEALVQVPPFDARAPKDELSTHYTDLTRKECMQCHLWSQGRAVRGRIGFDGDYRGAGCATCHVPYALEGLSSSSDRQAVRSEPGHPQRHELLKAPPTQTCAACHYGDASIGLCFRGLSQLPPNAPGGPEIPGTTGQQLNRAFYLSDPALVPPDVHHERGMHCIDCHTQDDVMGDGRLHGQMEHAVEITCSACHGSFTEVATLRTERGRPLEHVRWDGARVVLTSKVDGREHVVPQAVHVLDPSRPEYDADATHAMNSAHANLECYACHAGWNPNFLGFHFSRLEQLTQLDLLSGKRTPGRVTTQEKVFSTWKGFYAGRNERGAIAPFLTGFSTMGSVWDEQGQLVLDQVMPVTAKGLSGMTMIHHQPHTTRPTARSCVECHRTATTWGMGSPNFRLARQLAFSADERGVEVIGLERADLTRSALLAKVPLAGIRDLAVDVDPLQGHAHHVYAAEGAHGIHVIDVRQPTAPKRVAFVACVDPRRIELAGQQLYVADGAGGLRIFDVSKPEGIHEVGRLATVEANDVEVSWPWAYVADGPAGLCVVDVSAPIAPRFLAECDLVGGSRLANQAVAVASLFQYSRPKAAQGAPTNERTRARNLCAVLDREKGLFLLDVTEPELPQVLYPSPEDIARSRGPAEPIFIDLALLTQVDLADAQGGEPTAERDYAYVLSERSGDQKRSFIALYDVSDPLNVPRRERNRAPSGYAAEQLVLADFYTPPTRRRIALAAGGRGVSLSDLSTTKEPAQIGLLPGLFDTHALAVEQFAFDRMIDESGRPEKDLSHAGSRWLWLTEVERVLSVSKEALGTDLLYRRSGPTPSLTAREHFNTLDSDRSGALEGEEYRPGGGAGIDLDGDGRILLGELVRAGVKQELAETRAPEAARTEAAEVPLRAELARLLVGTDPYRFDADKNRALTRAEAERAFFAALDLDGDGALTRDELSRHPGELRRLRFGDRRAREDFARIDKNKDGHAAPREFHLADAEWEALDADHDGSLRLMEPPLEVQRQRGLVLAGSEWPSLRTTLILLAPGITIETLLATFDRDGDETLDQRELKARPDLLQNLDANRDGRAERAEIGTVLRRILDEGAAKTLCDDFLGRWDLDGSGVVEEDELPAAIRPRLKGD
ncbi:MAG: hypothetical protein EXS08_14680 [Planctomycetes bacterium]|nr:hypothetical protein [Planctomycetota bacterium]